jgi:acetylglutamate kinase
MQTRDAMTRDDATIARTLNEALPYLRRYADAVVVIKLGGHAMGSDEGMASFARDVVLMRTVGINPVVVHGGGPMINALLERLGVVSTFVRGKRVTDAETMRVVEMVLAGEVNKRIVQALNTAGGRAVGLTGKDADMITCRQTDPELGFVGTPTRIDPRLLQSLFRDEMIPVIAPIGTGEADETYNINGDTVAGALAGALRADRLLLLTDVDGVRDREGRVMTALTAAQVRAMTEDGTISGGMIPKTETALEALAAGVRAAVILDGRVPNAVLLELFTSHGSGSLIRAE